MEKLIFKGKVMSSGENVSGSLIQWDNGSCAIAIESPDGQMFCTTNVHPDSVECVNAFIGMVSEK